MRWMQPSEVREAENSTALEASFAEEMRNRRRPAAHCCVQRTPWHTGHLGAALLHHHVHACFLSFFDKHMFSIDAHAARRLQYEEREEARGAAHAHALLERADFEKQH